MLLDRAGDYWHLCFKILPMGAFANLKVLASLIFYIDMQEMVHQSKVLSKQCQETWRKCATCTKIVMCTIVELLCRTNLKPLPFCEVLWGEVWWSNSRNRCETMSCLQFLFVWGLSGSALEVLYLVSSSVQDDCRLPRAGCCAHSLCRQRRILAARLPSSAKKCSVLSSVSQWERPSL